MEMEHTLRRQLTARLAMVAALIGVGATLTGEGFLYAIQRARWVAHTYDVMAAIERVALVVRDAPAENDRLIRRYVEVAIVPSIYELTSLTRDNHLQQVNSALLREMIEREATELPANDRVGLLTSELRALLGRMTAEERGLLAERAYLSRAAIAGLAILSALGIVSTLAILYWARQLVFREIGHRMDAEAQLREANALLTNLAMTDGLTGLANRRQIDEALGHATALARRQGTPLSVILLDVDHFKRFNDEFGHAAGDDILRGMAEVLRTSLRDTDLVGRYGGEEFLVVAPGADALGSVELAERMRQAVGGRSWPLRKVTISIGVATLCDESGEVGTLVTAADTALYRSKDLGRDRVTHARELAQPMERSTCGGGA